jgi:hypothetical protein
VNSSKVAKVLMIKQNFLERKTKEGDSPVHAFLFFTLYRNLGESSCLGVQLKTGGILHPKLNMGERPIANKYREGKMKRTLKRE